MTSKHVELIVPDKQLIRLEYPTGNGLYEIYDRKTNVQVRSHWQSLLDEYPDDFLFVVRDNASSHVTPMLDDFLLENANRLCLVPMPTYSPNLNFIERPWKYMRDNITRNHFYLSFKELCEALVDWLHEIPFERFMSLMGGTIDFFNTFSKTCLKLLCNKISER